MMLVICLILALIPLLGIAGIVLYGALFTVDGLFMSLIFLAMSGILSLNVLYELRKRGTASRSPGSGATGATRRTSAAGLVERGKVESVSFFESNVGQPNKSIVTLSNGSKSPQMLVFDGDMRNALPVGQRVEITFRKDGGHNVLVGVTYS